MTNVKILEIYPNIFLSAALLLQAGKCICEPEVHHTFEGILPGNPEDYLFL